MAVGDFIDVVEYGLWVLLVEKMNREWFVLLVQELIEEDKGWEELCCRGMAFLQKLVS